MTKGISLVLALFLLGCGGGSAPESLTSDTKGETTQQENQTFKADKDGKVTTIELSGSAEDIAVSKKALFVAKGEDGVDIINIGYTDTVKSELITAIDGINARSVNLSDDGKKLYIVNEEGFVNIFNVDNLAAPVKEKTTTQQEIQKEAKTENGKYKYVPRDKEGLEIYSLTDPSNPALETIFNKSNAYDVVLADRDTKALIAAGDAGINLLDITQPTSPNMVVNFSIPGGTKGLSLNKEQGILFVANGDKGVLVYYLNTMLDKLSQ